MNLKHCPKCDMNRLQWCQRCSSWLCLTTECNYSETPQKSSLDGWIATSDRLPDHNQDCAFIVDSDGINGMYAGRILGGRYKADQGGFGFPGIGGITATFWRPMFEPPMILKESTP